MANCPWVQCDVLSIKPFRNVRTIGYLRTVRGQGDSHLENFSELPEAGMAEFEGLGVVRASDQEKSRARQAPHKMTQMRGWHFGI